MVGAKETLLALVVVLSTVAASDRAIQCGAVCAGKMTIECCECIGCHQGMRFGKRAVLSSADYEPESILSSPYALPKQNLALEKVEMTIADLSARLQARKYRRDDLLRSLARRISRF